MGVSLESTAFCKACFDTAHSHVKRQNHTPSPLTVPKDFQMMAEHCAVPRLFMELFAVVCIETSHYVAFVKAGAGQDAPWVFFDSMADRRGKCFFLYWLMGEMRILVFDITPITNRSCIARGIKSRHFPSGLLRFIMGLFNTLRGYENLLVSFDNSSDS